jgi:acetyl esterase/lipase
MMIRMLCFCLLSGSLCGAAEWESHVYKKAGARELKITLLRPPGWQATDHRPAILFFHGGSWTGGVPTQFTRQSEYLASRGMVGGQVEYRLIGKDDPGPPLHAVADAKSALRWVRRQAKELGIDPGRIAAGGGSAGGHLAAFTGMLEGLDDPADDRKVSPKADALVLFNPVFDNGPDQGWGYSRVGARYREFSPAHNITPDDPPAVIFLGTKDPLVPVDVVERFKAGMIKAGVRCEAHYYEGQGHGFFNPGQKGTDQYFYETLLAADRFLASLGWLQGGPTLSKP